MSYPDQEKKELIVQDQRLDQWHEIWQARVSGKSPYDIAKQFGLTLANVRNILADSRKELRGSIKSIVEEEMHLDLNRCDDIIAAHTALAAAPSVMVQRMTAQGDAFTEDEWKIPMESAKIVLAAIKTRAEILGYKKDSPQDKGMDTDSILWVRRSNEAKVIRAEPADPQVDALDLSWPE